MKFHKKFLIIFVLTLISTVLTANYGLCSDNVAIPPVEPQSQQTQQNAVQQPVSDLPPQSIPVTQQSPQNIPTQMQQPPAPPQSVQQVAPPITPPSNQGFMPVFTNMLSVLLKVILIILVLAGIIVLYRKIKAKTPSIPKIKKEKIQERTKSEPENVSEAVSSFMRHRIKRTP